MVTVLQIKSTQTCRCSYILLFHNHARTRPFLLLQKMTHRFHPEYHSLPCASGILKLPLLTLYSNSPARNAWQHVCLTNNLNLILINSGNINKSNEYRSDADNFKILLLWDNDSTSSTTSSRQEMAQESISRHMGKTRGRLDKAELRRFLQMQDRKFQHRRHIQRP